MLEERIEEASEWDARSDLVMLLVRQELLLGKHDYIGLGGHLVSAVLASRNGGATAMTKRRWRS